MSGYNEQLNAEKLHPYIVELYYHMDSLFIHMLNMLHLHVCVTVQKIYKISKEVMCFKLFQ